MTLKLNINNKNFKWFSLITVLIICIALIYNNFKFYGGYLISWDIFGYYLYLPLTFISKDLGMTDATYILDIIEKYDNTSTLYQAVWQPNGNYVMKYTMGMSILYAPFFFIGHIIAILSDYPSDGFSAPYEYALLSGGILYSFIGLIFLRKVLLKFFGDVTTVILLIIIFFGTNYLFHSSFHGQNPMSHNYLFTAYSIILWLTIRWHEQHKFKHLLILGIVCGLTILSRPSEIVCLIIPALWGVKGVKSFSEKIKLLWSYKWHIIIFGFIVAGLVSLQLIYWKIYTGEFIYNSYGANAGEGFEFFSPYLSKVLFSFRKGWLIYTPVMILALFGFIYTYKKNRNLFIPFLLFFIANLYIVSSWSCWWYAQSFGQRAMIPSYPIMAILLGYFIDFVLKRKRIIRILVLSLMTLLIALNIFQTWQYAIGVIDGSRMTKAYYFATFGKTRYTAEDRELLMINRSFEHEEQFTDESKYTKQKIFHFDFEDSKYNAQQCKSGKYSQYQTSDQEFSDIIKASFEEITQKDHAWLRVSCDVFPLEDVYKNPFGLVIHFEHNGFAYKYRKYASDALQLKANEWNHLSFDYLTPEVRKKENIFKAYIWNYGGSNLYLDNLKVEVFEPINSY